MLDQRTSLCACLPHEVAQAITALPAALWDRVQEVRLRADAAVVLSEASGDRVLDVCINASQVKDCFVRLCEHAVHTHQEELRYGFITTRDGFRVGVAGTAVIRDGAITSFRDITSLCVRISRVINGCATALLPYVESACGLQGLLLCGPPAAGKTTLLRDLAMALSYRRRVTVVDERCELSSGGLPRCDVLRGCPKAVGMLQAIRTLAPDIMIADELGEQAEWEAVAQCLYSGVAVVASVHARNEKELVARRGAAPLLENGGFEWVAFLPPRDRLFAAPRIRKVEELFEDHRDPVDCLRLCGNRFVGGEAVGAGTAVVANLGDAAGAAGSGATVCRVPYSGDFVTP